MSELVGRLLPAVIAVLAILLVVAVAVVAARAARRGHRARARAEAERDRAAAALVQLDGTIEDLDVDFTLSGVLHDPAAPPSVRRARMTTQHARDDSAAELRAIASDARPADIRQASRQVLAATSAALAAVQAARRDHDAWVREHVDPQQVLADARRRLAEVRAALGDPRGLLDALAVFDEPEWRDAADAAAGARRSVDEARRSLDEADAALATSSDRARPALEAAERSLRRAVAEERTLEELHHLVLDAARAAPGELAAARAALAEAADAVTVLPAAEALRVRAELDDVVSELDRLAPAAQKRPAATVRAVALLRERADGAVASAVTGQQRVRGARTALPGTLAAARTSLAHAEARLRGADRPSARLLVDDAQHALAQARTADGVEQALVEARNALHDADRSVVLLTPDG